MDTEQKLFIHPLDLGTLEIYDNLLGTELCAILPSGIYQSLFDFNDSLRKLVPYKGKILPGHDQGVFRQRRYPE